MSRIGNNPIKIESGVTVTIADGNQYGGQIVTVKGTKGELQVELRPEVEIKQDGDELIITKTDAGDEPDRVRRSYHGLYRTLVANAVEGVTEGYQKELEIVGIGYKAEMQGRTLNLTIGLNHDVPFELPEGIDIEVKDQVYLTVKGIDKQLVGEVAASIRSLKQPEPYKGKGIRYSDEQVRRKVGKTAASE